MNLAWTRKNTWILLTASLLAGAAIKAQSPETLGSAEIFLRLKKLNVLGSVLYIAAHPDDENSRLIAYMAKERLFRTGYLSMTRGDGGQNLIGDEQGVALGLIRTQEMMRPPGGSMEPNSSLPAPLISDLPRRRKKPCAPGIRKRS